MTKSTMMNILVSLERKFASINFCTIDKLPQLLIIFFKLYQFIIFVLSFEKGN